MKKWKCVLFFWRRQIKRTKRDLIFFWFSCLFSDKKKKKKKNKDVLCWYYSLSFHLFIFFFPFICIFSSLSLPLSVYIHTANCKYTLCNYINGFSIKSGHDLCIWDTQNSFNLIVWSLPMIPCKEKRCNFLLLTREQYIVCYKKSRHATVVEAANKRQNYQTHLLMPRVTKQTSFSSFLYIYVEYIYFRKTMIDRHQDRICKILKILINYNFLHYFSQLKKQNEATPCWLNRILPRLKYSLKPIE